MSTPLPKLSIFKKNQAYESAKAYLSDRPEIVNLIKLGQLQPLEPWRIWTDCWGHKLILGEQAIIIRPDLRDSRSLDIHTKTHPLILLSNSQWVGIINKGEEYYIFLLGKDIIRLSHYKNGWLENCSLLSLELKILCAVLKNLHQNKETTANGWRAYYSNMPMINKPDWINNVL